MIPQQRAIVVTGASNGIGLAIARRFAASGDCLMLGDLVPSSSLQDIADLADSNGGQARIMAVDVRRPVDAQQLITTAVNEFGRLDVLVNNAGILKVQPSHLVTWEDWNNIISTNLHGTWVCLQTALLHMYSQGSGRIINISSELGLIGFSEYAAYCASKGGVIALTKAIAKEVASLGILVNSVAPGPIDTDLLKTSSTEYNDATREQIPLRRFGDPDEVAAVVEFLAGPGGTYFVGQVISPNGGTAI